MKRQSVPAMVLAILLIAAACTTAATPTPGATPATGPTASTAPTATPVPTPTLVAQVPSDQLLFAGKLIVCSDLPYPPLEYFDPQGNPIGSDMDLAAEVAKRLGLQIEVINSVFSTIIEAVNGGRCDIIWSDQNITPERTAAVDMIPYFQAGQAFAVLKGNPSAINTELDLCGKKIGAETGTTEVDYAQGPLLKKCTDAGKPAPDTKQFDHDSDAFLALAANQVDVYFADLPVVAFYVQAQPTQFEVSPIPAILPVKTGVSVPKTKTGLRDAVKAALLSMITDGTYSGILTKYSVASGAITASDVVVNQP
jgi:polar amino acid transport system substrate-binding protein